MPMPSPKRPKLETPGTEKSNTSDSEVGPEVPEPDVCVGQLLTFDPMPPVTLEQLAPPCDEPDVTQDLSQFVILPELPHVSLPDQPTYQVSESTSSVAPSSSVIGESLEICESLEIPRDQINLRQSETSIISNLNLLEIGTHSVSPEPLRTGVNPLQSCIPAHSELVLTHEDYSDAQYCDEDQDCHHNLSVEQFHDAHDYLPSEEELFSTSTYFLPEASSSEASQPVLIAEKLSDLYQGNQRISQHQAPPEDPPIYDGSRISVSECAIAFLTLMLSYNVSGELMGKFLSFIQLILPSNNKFFSSLHSFLRYFESIKSPLKFIYYCSVCLRSLNEKTSVCEKCGKDAAVNYYIHLPIISQIKDLYANPTFVEAISYRFNRTKITPNNYEDIYDGELWKSVEASGYFSQPLNTTLMFNTDGLSIYNSSNFQIWPIYLVFNELPPNLRFREEFIMLAGLAFGNEKPAPNVLLKPLNDELNVLKTGIDIKLASANEPIQVKSMLLCGTCDAPAKSLFMRLTNFNGFYGCPRCLAKGEKSEDSGNVFVYPFAENLPSRTIDNYIEHLHAVNDNGYKEAVYGVKGPTYLFNMMCAFFLTSTAVDVMHNVYLGICRHMFSLWTDHAFIKKVFGDNTVKKTLIDKLSAILCRMNAPHYMSRPPRSLDHVNYFKASEFRTWLFSTSLPLMENVMKEPYLSHFKKLVCSISLLNMSSVSVDDVNVAKTLLQSFVSDFQLLYGLRNMSFNVHCLLHLSDVVTLLGPLHFSSCFGFESLNGRLARLVHGTRHAGLQIYANLDLLRHLSPLIKSLPNVMVKSFCETMTRRSQQLHRTEQICKGVEVVGNIVKEHVLPPEYNDALCEATAVGSNLAFFFRLKKQKFLYVSEDYGRGSRNSAIVKYKSCVGDQYGSVKCFVKVTNHPASYNALVKKFDVSIPFSVDNIPIPSILLCSPTETVDFVPVSQLECVCFLMWVNGKMFLSVPLNYFELE